MIERGLKLREVIELYCACWRLPKKDAHDLSNDFLDNKDWEELEHFKEILEPFHELTKVTQGKASDG